MCRKEDGPAATEAGLFSYCDRIITIHAVDGVMRRLFSQDYV